MQGNWHISQVNVQFHPFLPPSPPGMHFGIQAFFFWNVFSIYIRLARRPPLLSSIFYYYCVSVIFLLCSEDSYSSMPLYCVFLCLFCYILFVLFYSLLFFSFKIHPLVRGGGFSWCFSFYTLNKSSCTDTVIPLFLFYTHLSIFLPRPIILPLSPTSCCYPFFPTSLPLPLPLLH